jgi:hypothetical protein
MQRVLECQRMMTWADWYGYKNIEQEEETQDEQRN